MSTNAIGITLSGRPLESSNSVLLEQQDWDANVNYLTKFGLYAYLRELVFGGEPTTSNCSTNKYTIYAYPSPQDLSFLINATHGKLGDGIEEDLPYTEIVQCNLINSLDLKYPPISIDDYAWIGSTYDNEGNEVPSPTISVVNNKLEISDNVYGSIFVTYMVHRITYSLDISPLEDAIENKLQSFVYACWDYGNTNLECKFPDGADSGTCNNDRGGDTATVNIGEKDQCITPETEYEYVDYCKNII